MAEKEMPAATRGTIMNLLDMENGALVAMNSNLNHLREISKSYDIISDEARKMELMKERYHREELQEKQRDRHRYLADLNSKVRRYLDMLPADAVVEGMKTTKFKLEKGQTHLQAVTELRLKIFDLIGERASVDRASLPRDELKAQARKWITERAIKAKPTLIANHDKPFTLRYDFMDPEAFSPSIDVLALLAWLDGDFLYEKLCSLIDEMPYGGNEMTPAARAERLRTLKVELDEAERLEVALINAALDTGTVIDHRPNVSVDALLGITVSRKSKKAA